MSLSDQQTSPPSLMHLAMRSAADLLTRMIIRRSAPSNFANREFEVYVHQSTGSTTIREVESQECPLPASKSSIESLPRVGVPEPGLECPICLTEYEVDVEVKEMPCGHKFHSGCLDPWLGIHGSCPVCRFVLPERGNKRGREEFIIHLRAVRGRSSESGSGLESGQVEGFDMGSELLVGLDSNVESGQGEDSDSESNYDDNYDVIVEGMEIEFSN